MKERYIRQVRRSLRLPHKAKEAVARDLTEIFDSALEHGETEQAVVKRLGTAQEFAAEAEKQLRDGGGAHWRWGDFLAILFAPLMLIDAAVILALGLLIQLKQSRVCAILLLAYGVTGFSLTMLDGRMSGWLIVLAGVFAVIDTFRLEKEYRDFRNQ